MSKKTEYYLIWGRIVGKEEDGICYLFEEGEWRLDNENAVMDHLMGYDPTEPPGSPYAIGNMSIMDEIEEITSEKAMELTGGNA